METKNRRRRRKNDDDKYLKKKNTSLNDYDVNDEKENGSNGRKTKEDRNNITGENMAGRK